MAKRLIAVKQVIASGFRFIGRVIRACWNWVKSNIQARSQRRWIFLNLLLPLFPWGLGMIVAVYFLHHPEWPLLGIDVYAITITLIAFNMGAMISRLTEIVAGEFDEEDIPGRSLLWYAAGLFYAVMFTVYDVLGLKDEVHHWFWGRIADLLVILLGGVALVRATATCKALKLHTRKS